MKKIKFLGPIQIMLLFGISQATAQTDSLILSLWEKGAPGFESRKNEPEEAKDYWVKNIHNPSVTVYFPPAEIANGTAVVICPGGGHRLLVYKAEGLDPARYLNKLGVVAIVLKYRLPREPNSPYSLDIHLKQDGDRAMRVVRSHYKEWKIDTSRVGMLGFSAGGEVVNAVTFSSDKGNVWHLIRLTTLMQSRILLFKYIRVPYLFRIVWNIMRHLLSCWQQTTTPVVQFLL